MPNLTGLTVATRGSIVVTVDGEHITVPPENHVVVCHDDGGAEVTCRIHVAGKDAEGRVFRSELESNTACFCPT